MEQALYIDERLVIPGHELWITTSLSGGPGGQHVNKVNSRVSLHWNLNHSAVLTDTMRHRLHAALKPRISNDGTLQVVVDTHRSQHRNRTEARNRLAALIRNALKRQKKRIPTRVSLAAKRRRVTEKKHRGQAKRLRQRPSHEE